jgi:hypothetical protein
MQAIQTWFSGTAPDNEPEPKQPSLVSDWNNYSSESTPLKTSNQSDQGLSFAEEGTRSVSGYLAGVLTTVSSTVTGASSSLSNIPNTTQWTYFAALFGTGILFLILAFTIFLPMLILSPSKFALTFSVGSGLILASLGALKGWQQMFGHMASRERLPFTGAYIGSLLGTLYSSLMMHSYLLSILFCIAQVITLVYYVASYFPGGAQGAQMMFGTMGKGALSVGGAALRGVFSGK